MKRTIFTAALLWMAAATAFALGVADRDGSAAVEATGPTVSETRELSPFTSVDLAGAGIVRYRKSDAYRVTVRARESIIDRILTQVSGGELVLSLKPGVSLRGDLRIEYLVEAPGLSAIRLSGSGSIGSEQVLDGADLAMEISGSGEIAAPVAVKKLDLRIGGSGVFILSGTADTLDFHNSGSGQLRAEDLAVRVADIYIGGAGSAAVRAEELLRVNIAGSGSVSYKGRPRVEYSGGGAGTVRQME